jgi:hypothetical protein
MNGNPTKMSSNFKWRKSKSAQSSSSPSCSPNGPKKMRPHERAVRLRVREIVHSEPGAKRPVSSFRALPEAARAKAPSHKQTGNFFSHYLPFPSALKCGRAQPM